MAAISKCLSWYRPVKSNIRLYSIGLTKGGVGECVLFSPPLSDEILNSRNL